MSSHRDPDPGALTAGPASDPDFRMLFESAPGLYLVLTPDFIIAAVSDAYLRATMTQRAAILKQSIFEVFPDHPGDAQATGVRNLRASLDRVLQLGVPDAMAVQKYPIRRPPSEGGGFEERYWSPANFPVRGADGKVVYIIHRVEDVTEFVRLKQRQADQERLTQEMRSHEERMEAEVFQRAQEIQEVNRRLRDAQAELEQRVRERTAELAATNAALRTEMDQTKRLEEQFRQAQKMEAIGTLAGGVAHDFNNLLTVISGYSHLALDKLAPTDPIGSLVHQVLRASERAAALTRQLLAFSRQQVLQPQVMNLNTIVGDTEKMLSRLIGEDVTLATVLAPNLGNIKADPGQIEQIVMNLAVNARDAMPEGGKLTIETANVELDSEYSRVHLAVRPGRYAMLAVSDTGCGMDEATRARIFEPFFTTKGAGKGTGLGLATVFGIVKQSEGHIWVYSEPGKGSTFKIYFPLIAEAASPGKTIAVQASPRGTETILLVEDEDAVRAITVIALRSLGYNVLPSSTGQHALQICANHAGAIHLLISDVVMPEMGGRRVADSVLALRPDVKILFLSGYTDDAIFRHGVLQEKVAFLQKPFTPSALAHKVREVLDS